MARLGVDQDGIVCHRLDEIVIHKEFNISEALSAIQFYYNLAKHNGNTIVVEIWQKKGVEGCSP